MSCPFILLIQSFYYQVRSTKCEALDSVSLSLHLPRYCHTKQSFLWPVRRCALYCFVLLTSPRTASLHSNRNSRRVETRVSDSSLNHLLFRKRYKWFFPFFPPFSSFLLSALFLPRTLPQQIVLHAELKAEARVRRKEKWPPYHRSG